MGPFLCFAKMSSVGIGFASSSLVSALSRCKNMTTSASCSREPDSLISASPGFFPSASLVSWDRATTGIFSSLARLFRDLEISAICS